MDQEPFTLQSGSAKLQGVHHIPEKFPAPYVISAHGMLSTKDSPKYTVLGANLVENGIGFVRFDFTGCGESSGDFADSTLTQRIEDLTKIIDWTVSLETCNGKIGLFGSSLGGTVALVASSLREVDALVLLATPVKQKTAPPAPELQEVRNRYPHFFDDFRANLESFPFKKIHHAFIIHGNQDQVVSPENAHFIYERIAHPKKIWIVKGADHQFLDEDLRKSMLDATVQWFKRFLFS
jgi:alpha/beta superfamily hydrolase